MRCSVPMFADLMVRTEILQSRAARLLVRSSSIQFEVAGTRGGKCRLMEAGCKNPEAETMSMSSRQKTHKVGTGEDSVGLLSKASNRMVMIFTLPGSSWLPERVKGEDVVMAREDYPPGAHACSRPFQTLSFFYCFTRFCLCAQWLTIKIVAVHGGFTTAWLSASIRHNTTSNEFSTAASPLPSLTLPGVDPVCKI